MNRFRLAAVPALAMALVLTIRVPCARAAAEVHRLNLVISAIPTQVVGGDFNDQLEQYNRARLDPRDIEGLDKISFGWLYDAELRYLVRQNVAVSLGVGQLRTQSKREVLPGILQDIHLRAELLSVPVHLGGTYYFQPYNQGDFQARFYLGGGFLSLVHNKALLEQVEINTDSVTTLGGTQSRAAMRDAPGYYAEAGVHMFFAARYSVVLGAIYRSARIRDMIDRETRQVVVTPDGSRFTLDAGGLGARMGVAIGF